MTLLRLSSLDDDFSESSSAREALTNDGELFQFGMGLNKFIKQ